MLLWTAFYENWELNSGSLKVLVINNWAIFLGMSLLLKHRNKEQVHDKNIGVKNACVLTFWSFRFHSIEQTIQTVPESKCAPEIS